MSWQVKRYSALMKSFHREADDKIIEGVCCSPATEEKVLRFSFFNSQRPVALVDPLLRHQKSIQNNTPVVMTPSTRGTRLERTDGARCALMCDEFE
jgi:hypothetical protein